MLPAHITPIANARIQFDASHTIKESLSGVPGPLSVKEWLLAAAAAAELTLCAIVAATLFWLSCRPDLGTHNTTPHVPRRMKKIDCELPP